MDAIKEDTVVIRFEDGTLKECSSAIIIPERAITEAGYVRTVTSKSPAHSKHEFQAMTQIALSRFQDGELNVEAVHGPFTVEWKNEVKTITRGLVVFLDPQGNFQLIGHSDQNANKLLQVAHRFFTRWVRVDI